MPLRILYVIPYFAPAWAYGGSVRAGVEITRRLAAAGHIVTVVTTDARDASSRAGAEVERVDGLTVHRFRNISNELAWRRAFLPVELPGAFARLVRLHDVVHLHDVRTTLNAAAWPTLRRGRVPYVLSARGGMPAELGRTAAKRVWDALLGRRLVDGAARLHAQTELERAHYRAFGVADARIVVIPNGIDAAIADAPADPVAFRSRHGIDADRPVVGFLGRLHPVKGPDVLLEAFARLPASLAGASLLFAGPDDGCRDALSARAAALGIADRVVFTGQLDGLGERASALRAADVIVLPSRSENQPASLLEALLVGTPSIVTDACGLAAELGDRVRVVPSEDPDRLAAGIGAALADRASLAGDETSNADARRSLVERFRWDRSIAALVETYRTCVSEAPRCAS